MCLAVPLQVMENLENDLIRVKLSGNNNFLDVSSLLLPVKPSPGDFVIVHAGFALKILESADAEETLKIFKELAALPKD